jgi:hypothetical protein
VDNMATLFQVCNFFSRFVSSSRFVVNTSRWLRLSVALHACMLPPRQKMHTARSGIIRSAVVH